MGFDPLPPDWYPAIIESEEMKPTKSGDGHYLQYTLAITDGPYKGRKVIDLLNLNNPNQTAMEIAYRQLSAICHAIGVLQITDTGMLRNRPLEVKLGLQPERADPNTGQVYDARNKVKAFRAVGAGGAPATGAPVANPFGAPAGNPFAVPAAVPAAPQFSTPAIAAPQAPQPQFQQPAQPQQPWAAPPGAGAPTPQPQYAQPPAPAGNPFAAQMAQQAVPQQFGQQTSQTAPTAAAGSPPWMRPQ